MRNQLFLLFILFVVSACGQSENRTIKITDSPAITSDEYWVDSLTAEQYHILREQGTERPFTGEYWNHKEIGTFVCRACKLPLFESSTKFKSGTGWPSFFDHVDDGVEIQQDNAHGMSRNEIHCARCKGHLGHIFEDGPQPTGNRYCVNSASILFRDKE